MTTTPGPVQADPVPEMPQARRDAVDRARAEWGGELRAGRLFALPQSAVLPRALRTLEGEGLRLCRIHARHESPATIVAGGRSDHADEDLPFLRSR